MENLLVLLKWSSRLKRKGEDSVAEALIQCVRLIICVCVCVKDELTFPAEVSMSLLFQTQTKNQA